MPKKVTDDLISEVIRIMNLFTRVIESPSELSIFEKRRLTRQFINVCAKASSFGTGARQSRESWERIWEDIGDLACYAKLVYVETGAKKVVSFATAKHLEIDGKPVFFGHLTYTLPEYQGKKHTGAALQQLLGPDDIEKFIGGYIVARTPNPSVYEGMNSMTSALGDHYGLNTCVYPQICDQGMAKSIPNGIVRIATGTLDALGAGVALCQDSFVLENLFKGYGKPFTSYDFNCRRSEVKQFFENHLCPDRQDVIMMVVSLERRPSIKHVA